MVRVKKDGVIYELNDGNQLSAFLSNGWQIVKPRKIVVVPEPTPRVKEEKPKPKRRRKKASK